MHLDFNTWSRTPGQVRWWDSCRWDRSFPSRESAASRAFARSLWSRRSSAEACETLRRWRKLFEVDACARSIWRRWLRLRCAEARLRPRSTSSVSGLPSAGSRTPRRRADARSRSAKPSRGWTFPTGCELSKAVERLAVFAAGLEGRSTPIRPWCSYTRAWLAG